MQKWEWRKYSYTILLGISLLVVVSAWFFGGLRQRSMGSSTDISEINMVEALEDLLKGSESSEAEITNDERNGFFGKLADYIEEIGDIDGTDFFTMFSKIGRTENKEMTGWNTNESMADGNVEEDITEENNSNIAEKIGSDNGVIIGNDNFVNANDSEEHCIEENISSQVDGTVEGITDNVEKYHADSSYFEDALFIGDSRTVGLYEYGGLGNAEVCADSGMNIYKVFEEEFTLRSGEKLTLEEILNQRQFGKIYIMLGINELGYDFNQTVKKFTESIEIIKNYQQDAIIYIMANLHITNEKSSKSEYFTNANIDKYNVAVGALADEKQIFYLDVNPLYDDEEGGLSTEFTKDHAHILGKYYTQWVDFILQNAIRDKKGGEKEER